jgi:hypothetical protein
MSIARGGYVGDGQDVFLEARERVDLVREEKMSRERLLLFRDGLIELCGQALTQEQLGIVFNRHPEHIGRVMRSAPDGLVEEVYAVLSSRVHPSRKGA